MEISNFLKFITEHFWHAFPTLIAAAVAVAIMLERFKTLYLTYTMNNEELFFDQIRELVINGDVNEAIGLCDRNAEKPVAQVMKKGLIRAHQPESLIENGLEIAVEQNIQRVLKRTNFLAMIANVATLLGLLGTIMGLVTSFGAQGADNSQQKTALLAQGISTAMNATILGLLVAVPCMVMFSILMNKSQTLVSSVETAAIRVMDFLKQRHFLEATKAGPGNRKGGKAA